MLEYCFKIKEAVEFKSYLTGAQAYILFWDLKKGNHRSVPLMVKLHPPTAKGGDRKRKEEKRPARDLAFLTEETKRILVDQLEDRFFSRAEIPSKVCPPPSVMH